ncbi:hypothetical protein EG832_15335 [bacterium]|nr:hypothetical protein [bacterium]
MNTSVYVRAYLKQERTRKTRDATNGNSDESHQEELPKFMIDDFRLATDLGKAVKQLKQDGYEVVSTSEIISGNCIGGIRIIAREKQDQQKIME